MFRVSDSKSVASTVLLILFLCLSNIGIAQSSPGISGSEIRIGSCSALDGPARKLGVETTTGASAYIGDVNAHGGVNGRKIKLIAYDDSYDPQKAPICFKRLMHDDVFAIGMLVGTPTSLEHVKLAEENKIPVVGMFTGAEALYRPLRHYVFNVRSSYYDETRQQVSNLWVKGMHRIAVIYPEDAFGTAVLEGAKLALKAKGSAPVSLGTYPRQTTNVDEAIAKVKAAHPDAVIVVGPYTPVAAVLKKSHAAGFHPQFVTVSFVGTEGLIQEAGEDAEGMIVTQVVPPPSITGLRSVEQFTSALHRQFPGTDPTFVGLEGYVDAMVLVEGIRRAGDNLTRERLITSLEQMKNFDTGLSADMTITYSAADHKGLHHVFGTVIKGGKAVLISDWQSTGQ